MNRRGFLQLLSAGLVGAGVDVDRLLWVPGARTYFLPSDDDFFPGDSLTPKWVTKEIAEMFKKSVMFASTVNRTYDDEWVRSNGSTVYARLPTRFALT